jgi:hypothetical protein
MIYYAHTVEDQEGRALPACSGRWQLLATYLRDAAILAKNSPNRFGSAIKRG